MAKRKAVRKVSKQPQRGARSVKTKLAELKSKIPAKDRNILEGYIDTWSDDRLDYLQLFLRVHLAESRRKVGKWDKLLAALDPKTAQKVRETMATIES